MRNPEYFTLVNDLHENWGLIAQAYHGGLPYLVEFKKGAKPGPREYKISVDTLIRQCVLDSELKLCGSFRKVLDDIAKGKAVERISPDEITNIAVRFREWHSDNTIEL
jgi:hypothetical protein